ncbi:phospholipid/cholesterol/gamma-HCH transport system substrate-binding protein [Herbihabitans rhizosphaerae]|uniref:Phospholipid/cholesterol/gamma-HCH transport system substrate-binding protein n=1 Tax=Herbihabitans rhizosphaerae TaxID=1872711 RepID=A0A4Q7KAR2_9PSEU|nr:MCE family protein [Herbihabitans rhizosphaerae]RZS29434.1 phospholipid/cholesterol/gamma-HCH transport system substrate-binding protein [Herbihabitans rhizosphaerae]
MSARKIIAAVALVAAGATGCGGLYEVPLPGGADLGDRPYRITVQFRDVLDLVPQSGVKINDVAIGRVETIELASDGRLANAHLVLNGSARLPGNAVARLRQSSVLGEKFIELDSPGDAASGSLADGATIPVGRTNRNPEIEEVFGALSMLLNGGGVGQLQQINRELNAALGGNEKEIKSVLANLRTFVGGLDEHRGEIVRALQGMDKLAASLGGRKDAIGNLIDNLGPGVKVLADQRVAFTTMLQSLNKLSTVAVDTIRRSKDDLVADLRAMEPILRKLLESGDRLPKAMELLLTFPFPDSALDAIKGDYLNAYLRLHARTGSQQQTTTPAGFPLPAVEGGAR